jgi:Na+/H+ antiporter NhaD/arsenite permease-like protein
VNCLKTAIIRHKQHWIASKIHKWSDVTSLKAKVLLIIIYSAATHRSKFVENAFEKSSQMVTFVTVTMWWFLQYKSWPSQKVTKSKKKSQKVLKKPAKTRLLKLSKLAALWLLLAVTIRSHKWLQLWPSQWILFVITCS